MRYSQYLNSQKGVKGHLWQGRFYSCTLDEKHLYAAIKYVENNPVRANIVESPEQYRWSSARGHMRTESDSILSNDCYLKNDIRDWLGYLKEQEEKELITDIRKNTMTGRPCGNELFIDNMESMVGRRLKALSWGRPRKEIK
jgi:putative transposase